MNHRCAITVVCALLVAGTLHAQDAGSRGRGGGPRGAVATGGEAAEISTRTYNVADLLRTTGDYPLEGQRQGNQGPGRPVAAIDIDSIANMIQSTIKVESWANNGGAVGRVQPLGTMLVVTQTNETHAAITQLLNDVRRTAGPNNAVNMRLTWLQTDARQLLSPSAEVNDEWMAKQKAYCESQITCFNGQTVHHVAGLDKSYVSDLTPIVGTNAVAFDPTIGMASTGVKMQLSPQIVDEMVVLDVHAEVSEAELQSAAQVVSIFKPENAGNKETVTANVDRVNTVHQHFKTTTRIPLRKKMIIGGMTLEPASGEQGGRQLYLVVEIDTIK